MYENNVVAKAKRTSREVFLKGAKNILRSEMNEEPFNENNYLHMMN